MRMAELSRTSGVPVATIKYYLRERLVPEGVRTAANQATYDEGHLRRVRLVRALTDIGGLSVAQVRDVVTALEGQDAFGALVTAHNVLSVAPPLTDEDRTWAQELLTAVTTEQGWTVWLDAPAATLAMATLVALRDAGHPELIESLLRRYARVAMEAARTDVNALAGRDADSMVGAAVVGTVLGAPLLNALRMLAHQSVSNERWGTPTDRFG